MNLKALAPEKYTRIAVAYGFADREVAREAKDLKEAVRFLRRGVQEGALYGVVVWVLEETEDYTLEHRVFIHF